MKLTGYADRRWYGKEGGNPLDLCGDVPESGGSRLSTREYSHLKKSIIVLAPGEVLVYNRIVTDIRVVCLNRTSNRQNKLATQLHSIMSRLVGRSSTRISVTRVLARGAAYMRLRGVNG